MFPTHLKHRSNIVLKKYALEEMFNIKNIYSTHDVVLKYHNSNHIYNMLDNFFNTDLFNYIDDDNISPFIIAIIYHDSVYTDDTTNSLDMKNEDKSIGKFTSESKCINYLNTNEIIYIADLIRSTKMNSNHYLVDMQVLHDLDYSAFSEPDFDKYMITQNNVLEECFTLYSNFSKKDIILKRIEFLDELYQKDYIYYFNTFVNEVAKRNMKKEVRELLKRV